MCSCSPAPPSAKSPTAPTRPAVRVHGRVLEDCCRYYEFKVTALDESEERARFEVETRCSAGVRDVFGFNRAQHAVIETAILATRLDFLPPDAVAADLERYRVLVDKTGGDREQGVRPPSGRPPARPGSRMTALRLDTKSSPFRPVRLGHPPVPAVRRRRPDG